MKQKDRYPRVEKAHELMIDIFKVLITSTRARHDCFTKTRKHFSQYVLVNAALTISSIAADIVFGFLA